MRSDRSRGRYGTRPLARQGTLRIGAVAVAAMNAGRLLWTAASPGRCKWCQRVTGPLQSDRKHRSVVQHAARRSEGAAVRSALEHSRRICAYMHQQEPQRPGCEVARYPVRAPGAVKRQAGGKSMHDEGEEERSAPSLTEAATTGVA